MYELISLINKYVENNKIVYIRGNHCRFHLYDCLYDSIKNVVNKDSSEGNKEKFIRFIFDKITENKDEAIERLTDLFKHNYFEANFTITPMFFTTSIQLLQEKIPDLIKSFLEQVDISNKSIFYLIDRLCILNNDDYMNYLCNCEDYYKITDNSTVTLYLSHENILDQYILTCDILSSIAKYCSKCRIAFQSANNKNDKIKIMAKFIAFACLNIPKCTRIDKDVLDTIFNSMDYNEYKEAYPLNFLSPQYESAINTYMYEFNVLNRASLYNNFNDYLKTHDKYFLNIHGHIGSLISHRKALTHVIDTLPIYRKIIKKFNWENDVNWRAYLRIIGSTYRQEYFISPIPLSKLNTLLHAFVAKDTKLNDIRYLPFSIDTTYVCEYGRGNAKSFNNYTKDTNDNYSFDLYDLNRIIGNIGLLQFDGNFNNNNTTNFKVYNRYLA